MNDQEKRMEEYRRIISEAVSLRKESGKTMQNIADEMGIKQPNLFRLESMAHEVKVGTLLAYLDALDCTLEIVPRNKKKKKQPKFENFGDLENMSAKQFIRIMMYMYKLAGIEGIEIIPDDEK